MTRRLLAVAALALVPLTASPAAAICVGRPPLHWCVFESTPGAPS